MGRGDERGEEKPAAVGQVTEGFITKLSLLVVYVSSRGEEWSRGFRFIQDWSAAAELFHGDLEDSKKSQVMIHSLQSHIFWCLGCGEGR